MRGQRNWVSNFIHIGELEIGFILHPVALSTSSRQRTVRNEATVRRHAVGRTVHGPNPWFAAAQQDVGNGAWTGPAPDEAGTAALDPQAD
jgi:hypothetical protein